MKSITTSEYKTYAVKLITAQDTYAIRQMVLRNGQSINTCQFEGDLAATTFHLGVFQLHKLIGVATFIKAKHDFFGEENQYQLRGMAITKMHQGKQIGDLLLQEGEKRLKGLDIDVLWFNARKIAWSFYNRNGFKDKGQPFTIATIGLHKVMYKKL